ncbi:MAG: hypothetical protein SWH54_02195 [Thermodesulfobacteriota bacterium]|nr:hypothetical protein [Thermodesulfobacteriota bacterium]
MNLDITASKFNQNKIIRYLYRATIFFLVLTGFGNMPIFKRYYIADIPGLGWLAEYYVTLYIHYLFAILLIGIISYIIIEYLVLRRKKIKITLSGYIRGSVVAGLLITGILLVIRNHEVSGFAPGFIIFLYLCHLTLVMVLLMTGLVSVIFNKKWYFEVRH